jgi:ATP adenylyltransferase
MDDRPLWAPWRIEYVTSAKDGDCVFCTAPGGGDDAGRIVDRGAACFTILNAYPYASGHVMVAPYRHVADLEDLDEGETADLMRLTRRALAALRAAMRPDGFNVGLNLGAPAGAGIAAHLHAHVVPRWSGDTNFMPVLAGTRVISQALDATRDVLAEALRAIDG